MPRREAAEFIFEDFGEISYLRFLSFSRFKNDIAPAREIQLPVFFKNCTFPQRWEPQRKPASSVL
jgi:hypothetical protein